MTSIEMKRLAFRLKGEGKTNLEIAKELNDKGGKNARGAPLSSASVATLVGRTYKKKKTATKTASAKATPKGHKTDPLDAVRSILKLKMDAEEKVALALLVLS